MRIGLLLGVALLAQTIPPAAPPTAPVLEPPPTFGIGCVGPCHAWTSFTYQQVGTADRIGWNATLNAQTIDGLTVSSHGNNAPTHAMIIDAANAPGSLGKAFRHTRTPMTMSGGLRFSFAALTDVSVSFRMRYSAGFQYCQGGCGTVVVGNPGFTKETYGNDTTIFGHQGGSWGLNRKGSINYPGSKTFLQVFGNPADGQYKCFEYRMNIPAGTMEAWVQGEKILNRRVGDGLTPAVNYSGLPSYDNFFISNQSTIIAGQYTDYDDFRIDTGLPPGEQMGCPS